MAYAAKMKRTQKVVVSNVKPRDSQDHLSVIEGKPDWRTSNPDIANVIPTADGLGAEIIGIGFGTCQVFVRGDADTTPAQLFVEEPITVTVEAELAVGFSMDIAAPVAQ